MDGLAYKFVLAGKLVSRKGYSARQLTHQTSIVDFNHDNLPYQLGKKIIGKQARREGHLVEVASSMYLVF